MLDEILSLEKLSFLLRCSSERWFPQLHEENSDMTVFYALALAGEAGEVANLVKKMFMRKDIIISDQELGHEIADVFVYLLLLANERKIDIMNALNEKQAICEQRWGGKDSKS